MCIRDSIHTAIIFQDLVLESVTLKLSLIHILNKIAYDDDSGISKLVVDKIYGEMPRVEITLEEIR